MCGALQTQGNIVLYFTRVGCGARVLIFTILLLLLFPDCYRISCDLIEGVVHIYNKEDDTDCLAVIHLPGSEYSVDAKEPLQFSITVKHPQ